jgi:hypothetical protein
MAAGPRQQTAGTTLFTLVTMSLRSNLFSQFPHTPSAVILRAPMHRRICIRRHVGRILHHQTRFQQIKLGYIAHWSRQANDWDWQWYMINCYLHCAHHPIALQNTLSPPPPFLPLFGILPSKEGQPRKRQQIFHLVSPSKHTPLLAQRDTSSITLSSCPGKSRYITSH